VETERHFAHLNSNQLLDDYLGQTS